MHNGECKILSSRHVFGGDGVSYGFCYYLMDIKLYPLTLYVEKTAKRITGILCVQCMQKNNSKIMSHISKIICRISFPLNTKY
jgi:hypothetical protein